MYSIILLISTYLSILFFQLIHPLSLGLLILLMTLMMSFLMGLMSQSFWFAYILFLIFIGGMLIIFIYSISLIFNEKFKFFNMSFFLKNFFLSCLLISLMYTFWLKKNIFINNLEISNIKNIMYLFLEENNLNFNKLYNFPNNILNIFLILLLMMMMIMVVKITNFSFGPLRIKF